MQYVYVKGMAYILSITLLSSSAYAQTSLSDLDIEVLKKSAYDTSLSTKERIAAHDELDLRFPSVSIKIARDLVTDEDAGVATYAVDFLSSSIAMSDSRIYHESKDLSPYQIIIKENHEQTRTALIKALEDPRQAVRSLTAETLASLNDNEALAIIESGVKKKLFTERQAVNYFGLSDSAVGGKYILPYLNSESTDAKLAAVGYLGAYKSFQHEIRDNVLLNPNASPVIRSKAAKTLSKYDKDFTSYAGAMTNDPLVPLDVYTSTLNGYIDQKGRKGDWTSEEKKAVQKSISKYEMFNPKVDLKAVSGRLEQTF